MLRIVVAVFMSCISAAYALGIDVTVNGVKLELNADGTAKVIPYTNSLNRESYYAKEDIVIPDRFTSGGQEYTVVRIGARAFDGVPLKSIRLPETIKYIDESAFSRCDVANGPLILPTSVETIGESAFSSCKASIPAKVSLPYVKTIGKWAFDDSEFIDELELGAEYSSDNPAVSFRRSKNIKYISVDPENPNFASCDGIMYDKELTKLIKYPGVYSDPELVIPGSVKSIGEYSFSGSNITKVTLPEHLRAIYQYAFRDCENLSAITFGSSLASIGQYAFSHCAALEEVKLPDSLERMDKNAFADCGSLRSVKIGNSLTSISVNCFRRCGLEEISIPENIRVIGDFAFGSCPLKNVILGSSVTNLGIGIFDQCAVIQSITSLASIPPIVKDQKIFNDDAIYGQCLLYCPKGSYDAYKSTDPWSRFAVEEIDNTSVLDVTPDPLDGSEDTIYNLDGTPEHTPRIGRIYIINGTKRVFNINHI